MMVTMAKVISLDMGLVFSERAKYDLDCCCWGAVEVHKTNTTVTNQRAKPIRRIAGINGEKVVIFLIGGKSVVFLCGFHTVKI